MGLAGFLQIPGGMVSWTPPRSSGGIPDGIGGILVGIPGGMPPGTFHNPGRDPRRDPAYFWRDPASHFYLGTILFKNGIDCSINHKIIDSAGRYIILKACI